MTRQNSKLTNQEMLKAILDESGIKKKPEVSRVKHLGGRTGRAPWVKVVLDEAERGIAPGQAAVFYSRVKEPESKRVKKRDFEVLGGGIIS